MMPDGKIENSSELEFVVFCIENVAAKFYHSEVYQLLREGVSDMHCMSDAYLAEELEQEYRKTGGIKA